MRIIDSRFRLIGEGAQEFAGHYGLAGHGQYAHDVTSAMVYQPAPGMQVLRKVGALNARPDGLGETVEQLQAKIETYARKLVAYYAIPSWLRWAWRKPRYTAWLRPAAAQIWGNECVAITNRLTADADTGDSIWAVGNEPNVFPSIEPEDYAAIFARYCRMVRAANPSAQILLGELFMTDLIPPEVRGRIFDLLIERGAREADALVSRDLGVLDGLLGSYDERVTRDVVRGVAGMLKARLFRYTTAQYLERVCKALPDDCAPDGIGLHAYPFWDPSGPTSRAKLIEVLLDVSRDCQAVVFARWGRSVRVHLTEFGNPQPALDGAGVVTVIGDMLDAFTQRTNLFQAWYLFKPTGTDKQLPLDLRPFSRFVDDAGYQWDGNPPLNDLGRMYLKRAGSLE